MRNFEEIFWELKDLSNHVAFVVCWNCEIELTAENGYRFKDLKHDDYALKFGFWADELIYDAFTNIENEPLKVDKPGFYEFEAVLMHDDGEQDEYGRYYARPYMQIAHIEYKWHCTVEEMAKHIENNVDLNIEFLF